MSKALLNVYILIFAFSFFLGVGNVYGELVKNPTSNTFHKVGHDTTIYTCDDVFDLGRININSSYSGSWSKSTSSPTSIKFSNVSSPTSQVSGLCFGLNVLIWKVDSGNMLDSTIVVIHHQRADAGNDSTFITCNNIVELKAPDYSNLSRTVQEWFIKIQPAGNSVNIVTPRSPNTQVINLDSYGEYQFIHTVKTPECPADSKSIVVSNRRLKATIPQDVKVCGTTGQLTAAFIDNSVRSSWALLERPLDASIPEITPINNFTAQASKLDKPGIYKFRYKISNDFCPSDSNIINLTNNKALAFTTASKLEICNKGVLNGNDPSLQGLPGAKGFWQVDLPSQASKPLFDSTLFNSEVKNFTKPGLYAFKWIIVKDNCESNIATVIVDVNQPFRVGILKNDTSICDKSIDLKAWRPDVEVQNATGKWDIRSSPLGSRAEIGQDFNTQLKNINKPGLYTVIWTVSKAIASEVCSNSDTVLITSNQPTIIDGKGNTLTQICGNEVELKPLRANIEISSAVGNMSIIAWPSTVAQPTIKPLNPFYLVQQLNTPGQYRFRWSISNGSCTLSDTFSVNNNQPTLINPGADQDFCGDSIVLAPQNPRIEFASAQGSWEYINSEQMPGINPVISYFENGDSAKVKNLNKPGVYEFKWTISNKECFKTDTVRFTSYQPSLIDGLGGANSNFCGPILKLTPLSPTVEFPNARGRWGTTIEGPDEAQASYLSRSNGTYTFKGFTVPGSYTLDWTVQNIHNDLTCTITEKIEVVNNQPTIIELQESINVCGSSGQVSSTLAPNVEFPAAYGRWKFISEPNKSPIYDSTSTALNISNLGKAGTYRFTWTINNLGCKLSDTIRIINDQPSSIDALLSNEKNDTSYCRSDFIMFANDPKDENPNFVGQWVATPGAGTIINANSPKALTSLVNGKNTYVWQIKNLANSTCKTIYDSVTIRKEPANYGIEIMGGETEIHVCKDTITLNLELTRSLLPDLINWNTKGSSTGAIITNRNSENPFITNLSHGKNLFEVEVMKGICSDIGFITVIRDSLPTNLTIISPSTDTAICSDSLVIIAPDPKALISSATGEWVVKPKNHSGFEISDAFSPTTTLTQLKKSETYSLIWSVTNGSCPAVTRTVDVKIDEEVNLPDKNIDTLLCGKTSFDVALSDIPGRYRHWEHYHSNRGVMIADEESPKTTISNLMDGEFLFLWKVENEACKDSVIVKITTKPMVSKAFAGRDTMICSSGNYTLRAEQPLVGAGKWRSLSENLIVKQDLAIQTIQLSNGQSLLEWKVTKEGYCSNADTVKLTYYRAPIRANAGLDFTTYAEKAVFNASDPSPGEGYWTQLNNNSVFKYRSDPKTEVYNLSEGENKFTWTVENGPCHKKIVTIVIFKEIFIVPNAFSPNNDLTNDFFEIKGLNQFGQAELVVFNRIGEEVYANANYNNNWDGKDKNGNRLDDDTYYFILKIENKAPIKNFVVLKR